MNDIEKKVLEDLQQLTPKEGQIVANIEEHVLSCKPFYERNAIKNLLTTEQFENLLNNRPFVTPKRFHMCYHTDKTYQWVPDFWDTEEDSIPTNMIEQIINDGVCYFNDCSRVSKEINRLVSVLSHANGYATDAHIYFSKNPDKQNAFGIHKDGQHNLIVQVEGTTKWKVGTLPYVGFRGNGEQVLESEDATPQNIDDWFEEDSISLEVELNPGDAIFIPAWVYHQPQNMTKRISVSFPMYPDEAPVQSSRLWVKW